MTRSTIHKGKAPTEVADFSITHPAMQQAFAEQFARLFGPRLRFHIPGNARWNNRTEVINWQRYTAAVGFLLSGEIDLGLRDQEFLLESTGGRIATKPVFSQIGLKDSYEGPPWIATTVVSFENGAYAVNGQRHSLVNRPKTWDEYDAAGNGYRPLDGRLMVELATILPQVPNTSTSFL